MRKKVYISGPISLGDKSQNFQRFCQAHKALIEAGLAPLNPGLTMMMPHAWDIDHETWMEVDEPWVHDAQVILRLPGESVGANKEVGWALAHRVPVITMHEWSDEYLRNAVVACIVAEADGKSCICYQVPGDPDDKIMYMEGHNLPETIGGYLVEWAEQLLGRPYPCHDRPDQVGTTTTSSEPVCPATHESREATGDNDSSDCRAEDHLAAIREERGKVYGEPKQNHEGIAMMWAPLLEPHAEAIANQEPLPAHVVALLMCALKLDRMRITFHADNYDDLANYAGFARQWQEEHDEKGGAV